MDFNVNSPILFVVAGLAVAVVLAQSVFFLLKAWRRGVAIGMDPQKLKRTARTAAVFTIAPAAAIVISVITLSKDLGVPLPWLRLSVVGNLSYETIAATNAESAMGLTFGRVSALTAQQYVTIASVMTIGIMTGIWLVPVIGERLLGGMINLEKRDKKWAEIFSASMFIGMISAFIGYVFCDFSGVFRGETVGLIPVLVMIVSALVITALGIASKKKRLRVLGDYALPLSLVAGMAAAIPLTIWLG